MTTPAADRRVWLITGATSGFGAGRTQVGALEETTGAEMRFLSDLHYFGPAAPTKAVLPHMRRQGGGWVVQFSSVRFLIVEPGAFRTGLFGKDAAYLSSPMPEYAETVGPIRAYVETGGGSQPVGGSRTRHIDR
jgi:NAD(P)-dependent dehydrogenase (short-subunit alcohol dehydrogenase family)